MKKAIKKMVDRLTDVGDMRYIYALLRNLTDPADRETILNDMMRLDYEDTIKGGV